MHCMVLPCQLILRQMHHCCRIRAAYAIFSKHNNVYIMID